MTREFDPVKLSVLANAFDGIVREMTSGLLRSARSSVINTARDFSCAVLTADNQLLAAAEGVPVSSATWGVKNSAGRGHG